MASRLRLKRSRKVSFVGPRLLKSDLEAASNNENLKQRARNGKKLSRMVIVPSKSNAATTGRFSPVGLGNIAVEAALFDQDRPEVVDVGHCGASY